MFEKSLGAHSETVKGSEVGFHPLYWRVSDEQSSSLGPRIHLFVCADTGWEGVLMVESWHVHLGRKKLKVREEVCCAPASSHHLRGWGYELEEKLPLPRWLETSGTLVTSLSFISLIPVSSH